MSKQQTHWCLQEGKESKIQEWVSCVKSSEEFVLKAVAVKTGSTKFADLHFRWVQSGLALHSKDYLHHNAGEHSMRQLCLAG